MSCSKQHAISAAISVQLLSYELELMEESDVPLQCYHSTQQCPQRARGFWSDVESTPPHLISHLQFFVWFFWVKQQKRMERPFMIHTLGKLEQPLPSQSQGWRCPADSISQWDWMCASVMPSGWVGEGLASAAAPKWDVVVRPRSMHFPWGNAGKWIWHLRLKQGSAALACLESLVSLLWYEQCWARAHRAGSKVVPSCDTISLSAVTSACVLVSSASQHKFNKFPLPTTCFSWICIMYWKDFDRFCLNTKYWRSGEERI